ncbi:fas apoptotic inhibitory molecule 1-like protein [Cricetulus griseus]|uniref:Fas apoptotic inhibitory molecule 1-like protein n=1 Tax=Cricetulus griseus TaxID=10029 RepID=A0A061I3Y9_CRIGR|nr:fas apoptotic inhibitory molecule 1-like protein [Cricetulus griseus]
MALFYSFSPLYNLEKMTDLVAVWDVALSDGVHKIEFEHGTTSGKRVVYVDGKEEIRKEWMFKLVGKETFCVGAAKTKATINIDAVSGFAYEYTLEIDGKSLKKYMENRSKTTNTWVLHLDGQDLRVVLGELGLFLQDQKRYYGCMVQWSKNGDSNDASAPTERFLDH